MKGAMSNLEGKKVAILVEKFYEDLELHYPRLRLIEAGAEVHVVGPAAGETYESKRGYPATSTHAAAVVPKRLPKRVSMVSGLHL